MPFGVGIMSCPRICKGKGSFQVRRTRYGPKEKLLCSLPFACEICACFGCNDWYNWLIVYEENSALKPLPSFREHYFHRFRRSL